jgi:hypothetical protein
MAAETRPGSQDTPRGQAGPFADRDLPTDDSLWVSERPRGQVRGAKGCHPSNKLTAEPIVADRRNVTKRNAWLCARQFFESGKIAEHFRPTPRATRFAFVDRPGETQRLPVRNKVADIRHDLAPVPPGPENEDWRFPPGLHLHALPPPRNHRGRTCAKVSIKLTTSRGSFEPI